MKVSKKQEFSSDRAGDYLVYLYLLLQFSDLLTTLEGFSLGIKELNGLLVDLASYIGAIPAIIMAKAICCIFALLSLRANKTTIFLCIFLLLDLYYCDVVFGNLLAISNILKS